MTKFALIAVAGIAGSANAGLIITGVLDGPLTGGLPKAIELYATSDIADLSIYNVETPNNGGTPTGSEFALSGSASAGQFLYISTESVGFSDVFGFGPDFIGLVASINGDDNVMLYENGVLVDEFGQAGVDGTGTPWEYLDGWAYRADGTGPDATFDINNWFFSGINFLDPYVGDPAGVRANIPMGTYQVPAPASLALIGLGGLAAARRRR